MSTCFLSVGIGCRENRWVHQGNEFSTAGLVTMAFGLLRERDGCEGVDVAFEENMDIAETSIVDHRCEDIRTLAHAIDEVDILGQLEENCKQLLFVNDEPALQCQCINHRHLNNEHRLVGLRPFSLRSTLHMRALQRPTHHSRPLQRLAPYVHLHPRHSSHSSSLEIAVYTCILFPKELRSPSIDLIGLRVDAIPISSTKAPYSPTLRGKSVFFLTNYECNKLSCNKTPYIEVKNTRKPNQNWRRKLKKIEFESDLNCPCQHYLLLTVGQGLLSAVGLYLANVCHPRHLPVMSNSPSNPKDNPNIDNYKITKTTISY
ncbi:hypothetical protein M9H77_30072 [Catharanthus roseus]|uniref:Uncharacterized protein n=1 Tax=Catharanthus roseus TaxID=4058 RepID=A0ACB9ZW80_CATRO|nr:hypothetical protein M9H77_30072 [Catharanthus roseus]